MLLAKYEALPAQLSEQPRRQPLLSAPPPFSRWGNAGSEKSCNFPGLHSTRLRLQQGWAQSSGTLSLLLSQAASYDSLEIPESD